MAEASSIDSNISNLENYRSPNTTKNEVFSSQFPDTPLKSSGGGGTMDGMNERVVRLEERTELFGKQLERIVLLLDSINAKLATLPSKEFLTASIIGALAIALAIASLTFVIADYATSRSTPTAAIQPSAPTQQPMIIVVPSLSAIPQTVTPPVKSLEVAPSDGPWNKYQGVTPPVKSPDIAPSPANP